MWINRQVKSRLLINMSSQAPSEVVARGSIPFL
jgi:hypothetical protein